jgi:hypothetical protein
MMRRHAAVDETEIARYLVLDQGVLELGLPEGWEVQTELDDSGAVVVKDAADLLRVDVISWPTGIPKDVAVAAFLLDVVAGQLELIDGPVTGERGELRYAWIEDVFQAADEDRDGKLRDAHCRWYLCTNGRVTGQLRFFYWHDDTSWARSVCQTILATVRLGSGVPLASPWEHWSLRDPS